MYCSTSTTRDRTNFSCTPFPTEDAFCTKRSGAYSSITRHSQLRPLRRHRLHRLATLLPRLRFCASFTWWPGSLILVRPWTCPRSTKLCRIARKKSDTNSTGNTHTFDRNWTNIWRTVKKSIGRSCKRKTIHSRSCSFIRATILSYRTRRWMSWWKRAVGIPIRGPTTLPIHHRPPRQVPSHPTGCKLSYWTSRPIVRICFTIPRPIPRPYTHSCTRRWNVSKRPKPSSRGRLPKSTPSRGGTSGSVWGY